jgi:hypothetical protein
MKKLMIYGSLLWLTFSFCNCGKKPQDYVPPTGVTVMQNVNVTVKDSVGEDLLNPEHANCFKEFKIYYLVKGEKKLYNKQELDASGGYRLLKHPVKGYYYLDILMDGGLNVSETKTLLQLGSNTKLDTIKTKYKSDPSNVIADKIWHNNKLVWQLSDGQPAFEIIRN